MNQHQTNKTAPRPKKRYILLRLWKYLYQHKWMIFTALFLTISSNLLALIGPMLSGLAIDAIEPGERKRRFSHSILLLRLDDRILRRVFPSFLHPFRLDDPFKPEGHLSDEKRRL